MRKLNLNLDDLSVESFLPSSGNAMLSGTVRANDYTWDDGSCDTCVCETNEYTCTGGGHPIPTQAYTCRGYTCPGQGETCYPAKTCINPE